MSRETDSKPASGDQRRGSGLAILAALFCFSAGPTGVAVQKLLVESFSAFLIIAVQMSISAAALWTIRVAFFPAHTLSRTAIARGFGLGIAHPGGFMIVYTFASARLDSVTAVVMLALMPALIATGGRVFLREPLRPVTLIGIAVSLTGLFVLVSERQVTGESEAMGYVLGVAGLALASGSVLVGRVFNTAAVLPWYLLAPLQVTGAAAVAWVGVLATGATLQADALVGNLGAFLYLALGMTAASYFAYNFALSKLTTPKLGLISAAGPGAGALAASFIFGTPIGPTAATGIAITLAGAALPAAYGLIRELRRRHRGAGRSTTGSR
ncbi:DMT family transporter [Oricola sp.]|uniref:DMT family transporter n=1 Tax=Oricola sp. TaxID=1979950 RepID=UPI003BAD1528